MNAAHAHLFVNHFPIIGGIFGLLILILGFMMKSELTKRIAYGVLAVTAFPDQELKISLAHHTVRKDGTEYQQKLSTKYVSVDEWKHFGKMFEVVSQLYDMRPARSK